MNIIIALIPSIIIGGLSYYFIKELLKHDEKKFKKDLFVDKLRITIPIKLTAYERLSLFLERISLDKMLVKLSNKKINAQQLQILLLTNIRKEYEHNLSQQIYISSQLWSIINSAKENTIKLINSSASKVKQDAPCIELSKIILSQLMKEEKNQISIALKYLRQEVAKQF